jgi:hypothetical protein
LPERHDWAKCGAKKTVFVAYCEIPFQLKTSLLIHDSVQNKRTIAMSYYYNILDEHVGHEYVGEEGSCLGRWDEITCTGEQNSRIWVRTSWVSQKEMCEGSVDRRRNSAYISSLVGCG